MNLCIFNNFEISLRYHVQGLTSVLLKLVILKLNKQTLVAFNVKKLFLMEFIRFI